MESFCQFKAWDSHKMAGASLDPRKAHKAHKIGDVVMILTWVNDERAMVLMPANRPGAPWFVILESCAHLYDNPKYLAQAASRAATVMGMQETTRTWVRVADIILNYLPDLIRMPSAPQPEFYNANMGEMHVLEDGKKISSDVIRVQKTGVEYE